MPAKSVKQRRLMAIAEHHPEKLYKKNKGVAKMSKKELHEYATTSEKHLPKEKDHRKENERERKKMLGKKK